MQQLRTGTAASVTAGSGGARYIWPGEPRDLPAAVAFFAARGWRHSHDTLDLVTDLAGYHAPPGAAGRAVRTGVTMHGVPEPICVSTWLLVRSHDIMPNW